jgi:WD40 repeat protein
MTRSALLFFSLFTLVFQTFAQIPHANRSDFAVYDPTGQYIALAGTDLILLDRRNNEKKILNAYSPVTTAVSFSNDGKFIAAETKNFGIYIYNVENPEKDLIFFQSIKRKKSSQTRLKFSPDNKALATSNSEKVVIYDLTKGNVGKIKLTIPIDPTNSHRTLAAFDASDDWKTFFFNMQIIAVNNGPKMSFKYGRKLSWLHAQTVNSVMAADGSKVAISARSGLDQKVFDVKTGEVAFSNKDLKTYALAANKNFTKLYTNQAIINLEKNSMKILYQTKNIDKNTKTQISVAPDNGDFMIGLYQFNADVRLKANLQYSSLLFNRVSIKNNTAIYYRDYLGNKKYDSYSADIKDVLRGRSARNITNKKSINSALATSTDGKYGINHLSRIIRRTNLTVSAPIFGLGSQKGMAADISTNDTISLVNKSAIYSFSLTGANGDLTKGKKLATIKLPTRIADTADVKLSLSPDGKYVAIAFSDKKLDAEFNILNYHVQLFEVGGKLIKNITTHDVSALEFSNNSDRLYFSSDKKLTCYSMIEVEGKVYWDIDEAYSWYTESGKIIAIALSEDDSALAYSASNGHNKVVKARLGSDLIKCTMRPDDKLEVSK